MDLKTLEKLHNQTLDMCKEKCTAEITDNNEGCMIVILLHLTADIFDLVSILQSESVCSECIIFLGRIAKRINDIFVTNSEQKYEMLSTILATIKTIEEFKE